MDCGGPSPSGGQTGYSGSSIIGFLPCHSCNHNNARNCSGVSPAVLAMPPMVMALMGLWRGITRRTLPLLMMMWPLSRAMR